ncbi:LysR family transcriptional regulator [Citrobacter koseri]|uniref:LysR family transcriptional regulator n=1 Tax=Citrobacter koseri TaxID=545 RepID=A0A2X2YNS6_CITKO|nr:LysR family transcriptional regulator [Citrobacter koseri]
MTIFSALMRRYHLTPAITQEVGEAMTIIGLVAAGLGVVDPARLV